MTVAELVGRVVTLYLKGKLAEDQDGASRAPLVLPLTA